MQYTQLSLFEQDEPDEIKTVDDFVAAAYKLFLQSKAHGWTREDIDFVTHTEEYFKHYFGGTCPDEFAGYTFYDYSPRGVRLQKFGKPYKEISFTKTAILNAIKRGGYK